MRQTRRNAAKMVGFFFFARRWCFSFVRFFNYASAFSVPSVNLSATRACASRIGVLGRPPAASSPNCRGPIARFYILACFVSIGVAATGGAVCGARPGMPPRDILLLSLCARSFAVCFQSFTNTFLAVLCCAHFGCAERARRRSIVLCRHGRQVQSVAVVHGSAALSVFRV